MAETASRSGRVALTPNDRVGRHPSAIHATIDDEVVALDAATGACFGLDRIGAHIWSLIEPPALISVVCAALEQRYAVEQATCEHQVIALLEDLRAEGLVRVENQDSPVPAASPAA